MPEFIETKDGTFIPMSEIVDAKEWVDPDYDGKRILIKTKSGDSYQTRFTGYGFRRFFGAYIKAEPGYEMLSGFEYDRYCDFDEEFGFHSRPVIAWLVSANEDFLVPVTLNGGVADLYEGSWAIKSPSGVVREYDKEFASMEKWEKARRLKWQEDRKRRS